MLHTTIFILTQKQNNFSTWLLFAFLFIYYYFSLANMHCTRLQVFTSKIGATANDGKITFMFRRRFWILLCRNYFTILCAALYTALFPFLSLRLSISITLHKFLHCWLLQTVYYKHTHQKPMRLVLFLSFFFVFIFIWFILFALAKHMKMTDEVCVESILWK